MAKRQRRQLSILIIPDDGSKTQEFKVTTWLIRVALAGEIVLVALVLLGGAAYWRSLYWHGEALSLRRENQRMRAEVERVQELAQVVTQMKQMDQQLRTMLSPNADLAAASYSVPPVSRAVLETGSAQVRTLRVSSTVGDLGPADLGAIPSIWPVSPSTSFVTREFTEGAGVVSNGHPGVDIAAPQGTLVVATGDGTVAYASEDEVMGNLLAVDHFGAFLTRYGHNDQFLVRVGDRIRKGQPIALVGSSGQSSSPHLHYEVWQDGRPRDPRRFLPK